MSTETENRDRPPSTKKNTEEPSEGELSTSKNVSLEDEWAAALAEQDQAETPAVAAPPPSTEDEWAAALAEQSQEEAAASAPNATAKSAAPSSQTPATEELPATEAALEDEWAAALAEQSQEEAVASAPKIAVEPKPTSPQTAEAEELPTREAALEDEWAAALAEQEQVESTPGLEATIASDEQTGAQTDTPASALPETPSSDIDNDEDMENDWAEVLEEQAQAPSSKTPAGHTAITAEQATAQEDSKAASGFSPEELQTLAPSATTETEEAPIQTQHTEEIPSADSETASEESVKMNWPGDSASPPPADPPPTEWKPKRIGEDSDAASPQPEELLAASMASFAAKEPPPELPLAATAAQATIDATMEIADDVAAIIQDEHAIEEESRSALEAKGLEDSAQPTETPTPSPETPTATGTQDFDPAPPNPQPPIPEASTPNSGEAPNRLRRPYFSGTGGSLFGMFTMNTLLTLLTFGVYSFWGRIKIRRYLHSQTRFGGARLAFHGTGGELFRGWMKAMAIFGIPYAALHYANKLQTDAAFQWSINIVAGLLVLCFIPIAIVGSHRYRMSRTTWRGISFSFRHSAKDFLTLYLKGTLFSVLTLGIYYPIFDNAKRAFLSSGTHFGSRAFGFTGEGKELGAIYFQAFRVLVLGLVTAEAVLLTTSFLLGKVYPTQGIDVVFWMTIGIVSMVIPFIIGVWFWFQATRQRYMWSHTTFGSARFQATMTGKDLCELKLTNLFLLVFSLGLAWPWVQTRNLQFVYYHVGLQGPLNLQQVVQEASTASPMGEELAGFFDTGFNLG